MLDALSSVLGPNETVLRTCEILFPGALVRPGLIALTNRRLLVIGAGIRGIGTARLDVDLPLEHVKEIHYFEGGFMDGPNRYTLTVESRVGDHAVRFGSRPAQQEGPTWPNAVLSAQRASAGRPAQEPAQDQDISAKLQRLAALHAAGSLTDREFAEAKRRLLN